MSDDERTIQSTIAKWLELSKAGNTSAVLDLMADDVVFVVVGRKPLGKEEFAAGAQALRNVRMEAESDVEEVTVVGDWAWSRTHLTVTMTPPNGNPMRRSGHTLTIWHKKPDGRWVIARDANLLTAE